MSRLAVISGALAQKPFQGGHAWVLLQYLLGFQQIGWDVIFLDKLLEEMSVDESGRPVPPERSINLRWLEETMHRHGLDGRWSLLCGDGACFGLDRDAGATAVASADIFLNIMGFMDDARLLGAAKLPVFLDIDPGLPQIWKAQGLADVLRGHRRFVTVGGNIGRPSCSIPTHGLDWVVTLPPVVLNEWPECPVAQDAPFTSVCTWRGTDGILEHQGLKLGHRVHEFRRFLSLPRDTGFEFELALNIHPDDVKDLADLKEHRWSLVDPVRAAGDSSSYRAYLQRSSAEFSVAKSLYTATRSGWFSDRTACYLASGRPAVVQNTGLEGVLPLGEGLLVYSDLQEARTAVTNVVREWTRHAKAARRLAEEFLDSRKVLTALLERVLP